MEVLSATADGVFLIAVFDFKIYLFSFKNLTD